jgi:hypothetical protein
MAGTVVPGASLAVRVDGADAERVAIDFDHQMDPGGSSPSVPRSDFGAPQTMVEFLLSWDR